MALKHFATAFPYTLMIVGFGVIVNMMYVVKRGKIILF